MTLGKAFMLVAVIFFVIAAIIEVARPQQPAVTSLLFVEIGLAFMAGAFLVGL